MGEEIIVDLFGGANSQIPNAINVDIIAESGIRADVSDLPQIFPPGSVSKIVASGPQAPFLQEAAIILKVGGLIYINATKGNKFGKVPDPQTRTNLGSDAVQQLGLQVLKLQETLEPKFAHIKFRRTDGLPIPNSSVKTTILEKL